MPTHTIRAATVVLAIASMCVLASDALAQARSQPPTATATDLSRLLEVTARLVSPSVVEIFTTSYSPAEGLLPSNADLVMKQRASGSGVIVDPDGYIMTNAHVVSGAQRVRVEIPVAAAGQSILPPRGRTVTGRIVGIDLETDLALIKVDERKMPALPFGDSDELKAGQLVLAFGSPLGLQNTVSLGVISTVARQLAPESPMIYVQTDAAINQGSSGGPLVDVRGRIVGINTLLLTQTGGNEGHGFAAPSNIVRTVYEQLKKDGRVRRGDIGVRAQTVTPVLASGLKLPREYGVVLADVVPGSPAARAGLRPGDFVVSLDGKPMENGRQLHINVYRRNAGEVATLEILRDGKSWKVPVTMAERQDPFGGQLMAADPRQNLVARLGILGVNLDKDIIDMLPVLRTTAGVVVASTVAGALDSREGGLAPGDVVFAVNRIPVANLEQLRAALDQLKTGDAVVLQLEREGELMYLAFTIE